MFTGYRNYVEAAHKTIVEPILPQVHVACDLACGTRAWCDCEWFVEEGRLWRRYTERVEEVCWTGDEIRDALSAAGFAQVREWDAAPFFKGDGVTAKCCRSFYLARK